MPVCVAALAHLLHGSGSFRVHVVVPGEGELANRLRKYGIGVSVLPFNRLRLSLGIRGLARTALTFLPASFKLFKLLRSGEFSVVHFSDFIDAPFYPVARLAGIPCVTHLRYTLDKKVLSVPYRVWVHLFCNRVIAISPWVQRNANLPDRKCRVVFDPGPDPVLFDPQSERSGPAKGTVDRFTVGMNADFRPVKGHLDFLKIAERLLEEAGREFRFVVIGGEVEGHERYHHHIRSRLSARGLSGSFELLGKVANETIPGLVAGMDVLVHVPQYHEGLGIVILEAFQMGVPVVAYDCGGVKECFSEETRSLLVPHRDWEKAFEKVYELVRNPELGGRLGESGRSYVLRKFSRQAHLESIHCLYDEVIRGAEKAG